MDKIISIRNKWQKTNGGTFRQTIWVIWYDNGTICESIAAFAKNDTKYVKDKLIIGHNEDNWPKFVRKFGRDKADRIIHATSMKVLSALRSPRIKGKQEEYFARADLVQDTIYDLLNPPIVVEGEEIEI